MTIEKNRLRLGLIQLGLSLVRLKYEQEFIMKLKLVHPLMLASSLFIAGQANAATAIDPAALLGQAQAQAQASFDGLAEDLAVAAWMNPSNSAEPHSAGFIPVGVQIALESAFVDIDPAAAHWSQIGYTADVIPMPRLRASVGVPFGLDVGVMYLSATDLKLEMIGYEVRMAFGNYIPVPFLEANVRYHTSTLTAGELEIGNSGFAAMVGANLPFVKPYIEVGTLTSTSTPSGSLVAGPVVLAGSENTYTTTAIGAKLEFMFMVLNAELATVGDRTSTNVKLGFEF